jgi:hypothetical protein
LAAILESGSRFDPPDLLWTWSVTAIVPATPGVTNGTRRDARRGDGEVSGGVGEGLISYPVALFLSSAKFATQPKEN